MLSWTGDWQHSVVEDAVSARLAQRHYLDSSVAPTNNIPTLSRYLLLNPPLRVLDFPLCLYSISKALGLSLSKVSSEAS